MMGHASDGSFYIKTEPAIVCQLIIGRSVTCFDNAVQENEATVALFESTS